MMTQIHDLNASNASQPEISSFARLTQLSTYLDEYQFDAACTTVISMCDATIRIIRYAFWLANQKAALAKKEFKKLLAKLGLAGEEKRYLKVAQAFADFEPNQLAQIEPRTIFQLAENHEKYEPIITELGTRSEITQDVVRELIAETRKTKNEQPEKPTIWRRTKKGKRYVQIPPIHCEKTGVILQAMMDSESKISQTIVSEGLDLRKAYIEGRLVYIEKFTTHPSDSHDDTQVDSNLVSETHSENFEPESEKDVEHNCDNNNLNKCVDTQVVTEQPQNNQAPECINIVVSPLLNNQQTEISESILEQSPTELLIAKLQNAQCWQEVREALLQHEDCKQLAWNKLTLIRRDQIMAMRPEEIIKLSDAKKAGMINDFREVADGVYEVRHNGCLFWEIVAKFRLDNFLAELKARIYHREDSPSIRNYHTRPT